MPLIDMPLEELKQYHGRNPQPDDFDAYWESALQEMRSTEPMLELVPASFSAPGVECFDLYFTGVRGARVHVKYLRPKNVSEPHPAVLMFHGYSGNAGDWMDKLSYTSLGYSVFAMDARGQGGLSEDTGGVVGTTLNGHIIRGLDDEPNNLLFRHIFLDTAELASIAMGMPEVDAARIGATGWSQGGALTLACASLEPRIKLAAPVYPFLCDYLRVWEMDLAVGAYQELKNYFRNHDPQHLRHDEIFRRLGYIDLQYLVPRIQSTLLMGTGLMDTICPPSTQFAAFNKITSDKNIEIYPDFGHEGLPGMQDKILTFMLAL